MNFNFNELVIVNFVNFYSLIHDCNLFFFFRDQLALKLVEKVNQNHKDKKHKALSAARSYFGTPVSKFGKQSSMERMSSMSPAAQKLLNSRLRSHSGSDRALRASYTPLLGNSSRKHSSGALTPASLRSIGAKTPTGSKRTKSSESALSLTDNLLELPKKSKDKNIPSSWCSASDFF